MQLLIDALGELAADALDARQILDARSKHPLKSTEMFQQPLAAAWPDGGYLLQARGGARLAAARAMSRDREAVRLVAHLLDEMQRRMVGRKPSRLVLAGNEELLQSGFALHALRHT